LNGMIYAYKGVKAYEIFRKIENGFADQLRKSIQENVALFDLGHWSYYDLNGNSANIKYHRIHVALLEDQDLISSNIEKILKAWRIGERNPGVYWILSPGWSFSKINFIAAFVFSFSFPFIIFLGCVKIKNKGRILHD